MVCFDCTPTWTRVLVHTHETGPWLYPVPNLNLNLIRLEQTYSTCARTPRTKQQTKQTINLDDAVELRSILNKTPRPTRPINIQNVSLLGRTVNKLQLERQRPWALLVEGDHNAWHNTSADVHTSSQTDCKHLGDNLWRFQRRGSPIPQQTWPSELTCSSQINLKQRVTAGVSSRSAVTDTCGHSRWCRLLAERAPRTPRLLTFELKQGGRHTVPDYRNKEQKWFTQQLHFLWGLTAFILIGDVAIDDSSWYHLVPSRKPQLYCKLGELKPVNWNFLNCN